MLDLAGDLASVFFGADFATPFTRQRPGVADVRLNAIVGAVDSDALESRAMSAVRTAHFASGQDVRADDKLIVQQTSFQVVAGTAYRVLDTPRRVNDGLELEALLGSATA